MVDSAKNTGESAIKFLCSYGGKILPRQLDGKLGYIGGETRVVTVIQSISFADLLLKLEVLSGSLVNLRCQLPKEDLDTLISITSGKDLENIIREYDVASQTADSQLKIKAFLCPTEQKKKIYPPPSHAGKYLFYRPVVSGMEAGYQLFRPVITTVVQPPIRYPPRQPCNYSMPMRLPPHRRPAYSTLVSMGISGNSLTCSWK